MGECEIKMEIRKIIHGCGSANENAINSIARAMKMRHQELDRQYVKYLIKNILKEIN